MAVISNSTNETVINGSADIESIYNEGILVTINGADNYGDVVENRGSYVLISVRGGNDVVQTSGNDITIYGGADDDSILSGGNNVSINTGNGNDSIENSSCENVTIDGGDGEDLIRNNAASNVTINAGDGNDTIRNFDGGNNVSISGDAGNDTIENYDGENVTISGGDGEDLIHNNAASNVTINAGDGNDTIYNISSAYYYGIGDHVSINGGNGDDYISNGGTNSTINGGEGNDTILNSGRYGFNNISGDYASINGGVGDDVISLESGSNGVTVNGGTGDDTINNQNTLSGNVYEYISGDGADVITGFTASDTLVIGDGTGTYSTTTSGNDLLVNVGEGTITLQSAAGLETLNIAGTYSGDSTVGVSINNTVGNTLISGTEYADTISSVADNVNINALGGDDSVYAIGSITVNGGDGNDTLEGSPNKSSISGGSGDDSIYTWGDGSNITISGNAGNDTINSSTGNNKNNYGIGKIFTYNTGDGNDVIIGMKSTDSLIINGSVRQITRANDGDIKVSVGSNTITLQDYGIYNAISNTQVTGTAYADSIFNGADSVTVSGLNGNDFIRNTTSKNVSLSGGAGNDTIDNWGMSNNATIEGGAGADSIRNYAESVTTSGGEGNDTIINGYGSSVESYYANYSSVSGGSGNDSISNRGNNVTISGGAGNDTISSSGNTNVYVYNSGDGADVITGFSASDTLVIGDGTGTYSTTSSGDDVVVTAGDGSITLQDAAGLSALNIQCSLIGGDTDTGTTDTVTGWATIISASGTTTISADDTVANGTDSDDTITTATIQGDTSARAINGLGGNDRIENVISKVTIDGGAGADSIRNYAESVTAAGGEGNDTIVNGYTSTSGSSVTSYYGNYASVSGGAGNDSISNRGNNVTITGGAGNDTINNSGNSNVYLYNSGDGADVISGFNASDTLVIGDGTATYSTTSSGDDVVVTAGDVTITLQDAANLSTLNIQCSLIGGDTDTGTTDTVTGWATIIPAEGETTIVNTPVANGTDNADTISIISIDDTVGSRAVYGNGGNDSINISNGINSIQSGSSNALITLDGGAGNDTISIYGGSGILVTSPTINGGTDDDLIVISGEYVGIQGVKNLLIDAGTGNDTVSISGNNTGIYYALTSTITTGDGNDLVDISSKNADNADGQAIGHHNSHVHIITGSGNDTVNIKGVSAIASAGVLIESGDGDDSLNLTGDLRYSKVTVSGGAGNDALSINGAVSSSTLSVDGGAGADVISVESIDSDSKVSISAGAGDVISVGSGGVNYLFDSTDAVTINGATFTARAANTSASITTFSDGITLGSGFNGTVEISGSQTLTDFGGNVVADAGSYRIVDGNINIPATWATVISADGETKIAVDETVANGTDSDDTITTASIEGDTSARTINGNGGNDSISNILSNVTINAGDGNDTVRTEGQHVVVNAGADDDYIFNSGSDAVSTSGTIDAGDGNDTVTNNEYSYRSSVNAGGGDDLISLVSSQYHTVNGGTGSDTIYGGTARWYYAGAVYQFDSSGGSDVIYNFHSNDTLQVAGSYETVTSGEDSILNVGENSLTLKDVLSENAYVKVTVQNTVTGAVEVLNDWTVMNGTAGNDSLINVSANVTVNALAGNDTIENYSPSVMADGGAGDDVIYNPYASNWDNTLYGGDGNDSIISPNQSQIFADGGNDSIIVAGSATVTGGTGDDTISNGGYYRNTTYSGGGSNVYVYNSGDGADVIVGFNASDTLVVNGTTYSTVISGNNFVVNAADGTITFKDMASITPNIIGEWFQGYIDKNGNVIENPVAQIQSDGETYYYESVARATEDADNNSTVTVTANSTETAQIISTKGLTIQFAESGLGVYNVTGGNFVSADNSAAAQFSVDSNRVTSNSNTLQLINGATATLDGYEVTRISNRYSVIGNSFDNNISNSGEGVTINAAEGNDSISNTGNNVSVVGGAGNDDIINVGDNVSIDGNDGDDYILSGGNNSSINAGAGNDTLLVTEDIAPNELIEIEGGDGNDSILAASIENNGELEIDGDEGNDIITITYVSNKGLLEIDGDDGDDIISVTNIMENSGKIDIEGDTGNDSIIIASLAADIAINISGDAGNDSITLTANAPATESSKAYTVSGGSGNDTITSDGADVIYQYDSGDGNDVIIGFTDSDTLLVDGTQYRARTINEDFIVNVAEDANAIAAKDKATFIIADSKVVSVDGFAAISGLSNATVHAIGNVAVNNSDIDVTGDNDFNVIVADSKVTGLANISAGASVSVANVNVTTDNNGTFKVGENVYTINDADGSVTFITNSNGEVSNVTNFHGTLKTSSRSVTINGAAFTTNDTNVTISSAGAGISQINGVVSGDVLSGDIDSATVLVTVASAEDIALWRLNNRNYLLVGDSDGVQVIGNRIDGLDNAASLEVGTAGIYIVNATELDAKVGDTIIGTAEGSAYIFDPNNVPLNVDTMTDDEIAAQAGVSTNYATTETDTEKAAALLEDTSQLNGNMELAISNSDTTAAQTADFTNSTGKKKITLAEGSQEVKFNDEGGNVAVIESDSAGEKNVILGGGGDLVIVKNTDAAVSITGGTGKDTIVTAGNNVTVDMKGGATKIVPNGGNVNVTNYNAATGAGIQIDEVADIYRAVENGNINFGDGSISFGGATINLGNSENASTTVNLFDNKGRKQKVAYTHSDGGTIDATNERENMLLVGNNNSTNINGSRLTTGSGNDIAFGGAGDYFDLGGGNNSVYLNSNRSSDSSGATVAMTATNGKTEVNGFNSGFGENADKVSINISGANVSFKNGKLTFSRGGASLVLNFGASSADLIADDNLIGESADLSDITPITYEQGDYQNIYDSNNNSLKGGVPVTFTGA